MFSKALPEAEIVFDPRDTFKNIAVKLYDLFSCSVLLLAEIHVGCYPFRLDMSNEFFKHQRNC